MLMMRFVITFIQIIIAFQLSSQDLSIGLLVNDLDDHPMQDIAKPGYLQSITDPSFGTTIRRITDAGENGVIVPMYSTVQAWNADESLMIVYNQSISDHQLLNGMDYTFIRTLDDFHPKDLEQIFWDFDDPDVLYYLDSNNDYIRYTVSTKEKELIVNLGDATSDCTGSISMGNDIQMPSWDSDVIGYRCDNDKTYSYRISTNTIHDLGVTDVKWVAAMPAPSGNLMSHARSVYSVDGSFLRMINANGGEHSCIGKLSNGNDAYFAVAFDNGPNGGCGGNLIAHDLTNGDCIPLINEAMGYAYSKSGTHISSLAHKNTEGGWVAASMIGFEQDGQTLLDQELVVVKADPNDIKVCRIGHHRSDEDQYDYWGEPHAVISPTGTRVLFGSDWSGADDGHSIDCYVVELPAHTSTTTHIDVQPDCIGISPNPFTDKVVVDGVFTDYNIMILDANGTIVNNYSSSSSPLTINLDDLPDGLYFLSIKNTANQELFIEKIIKQ